MSLLRSQAFRLPNEERFTDRRVVRLMDQAFHCSFVRRPARYTTLCMQAEVSSGYVSQWQSYKL